ncbi:hypothetical protein, partial [Porphyromonas loveana]|uniref:hypothetical protein n=1 Tax=Porphyromonas loveana TaxID=1884669 RepID=UPI00359FBDBB
MHAVEAPLVGEREETTFGGDILPPTVLFFSRKEKLLAVLRARDHYLYGCFGRVVFESIGRKKVFKRLVGEQKRCTFVTAKATTCFFCKRPAGSEQRLCIRRVSGVFPVMNDGAAKFFGLEIWPGNKKVLLLHHCPLFAGV